MSIYTPKMRAALKTIKPPHDLQVDIVEYDLYPPFIGLRFYESQWYHLSESERLRCIEYLKDIKRIIEAFGVNATLDPVYDKVGGQKLS
jgi:hypothetical protein